MKRFFRFLVATSAIGASLAWAQGELTEAEVRRIDRASGKITLRHAEIKNLDMPPMTMVFQMRDRTALDALKEGDKVKFKAEKIGSTFTVTEIRAVP